MDSKAQLREQMALLFDVSVDDLSDDLVINKDIYASSLHFFGILSGIEELTGKTVEYDRYGCPFICKNSVFSNVLKVAGVNVIHVSITTEKDYATAFVVAES